tara:strand:- start:90 stop:653 length:564 start_codon:yes stop_codon:yes gene_type:complete
MREEKDATEAEYDTRNLKKAARIAALQEAREAREMMKRASNPIYQAKTAGAIADAMNPGGARGPTQTIDVRSGMAGSAGRTAQAARAAGQGAGTAAQQAASRVQQQAAGQLRERYGLQAQEAARQRVAQGLATAGAPTFAEQLAQQTVTGAAQQALGLANMAATGGIAQGLELTPEMLSAMQGGKVA